MHCRPAEHPHSAFAPLACVLWAMMQRPGVSYAGRSTAAALDRPQAEHVSAKMARAGTALENARLDASPELIDKLEHLEGEEKGRLLSLRDRHAEAAYG